jgi:hypothetical protein
MPVAAECQWTVLECELLYVAQISRKNWTKADFTGRAFCGHGLPFPNEGHDLAEALL